MQKFLKSFDSYKLCVWVIVGMLIISVMSIPFATKPLRIGTFSMSMTPILVILPILLGVGYATIVSYEKPKMKEEEKFKFRIAKAIVGLPLVALNIAVLVYSFI